MGYKQNTELINLIWADNDIQLIYLNIIAYNSISFHIVFMLILRKILRIFVNTDPDLRICQKKLEIFEII